MQPLGQACRGPSASYMPCLPTEDTFVHSSPGRLTAHSLTMVIRLMLAIMVTSGGEVTIYTWVPVLVPFQSTAFMCELDPLEHL